MQIAEKAFVPWVQKFTRYKDAAAPANFHPGPSLLLGRMLANVSLLNAIRWALSMTAFFVSHHTGTLGICRNYALPMLIVLIVSLLLPVYWAGLWFSFLGCVGLIAGHRKVGVYIAIAGGVACYWGWYWHDGLIAPTCYRREVGATGSVSSLPLRYKSVSGEVVQSFRLSITLNIPEECGSPRRLMVYGVSGERFIPLGAEVTVRGRLTPNRSQWNLGSVPDQALSLAQGLHGRLSASHVALSGAPSGYLSHVRQQIADAFGDLQGPPRVIGVLEALVLGTGRGIAKTDWERFRFLGITHAFVVSGLHLSLVFMVAWSLSRRLLFFTVPHKLVRRDWAIVPALGITSFYAALAGFSLPTQRALIMLLLVGILRLTARRTPMRHIFVMAALIILMTNYFTILGRSFWLSMVATGILMWLVTWQNSKAFNNFGGWLSRVFLMQTVLVLLMAPVTLFWFGQMTLAAVAANVFLVPVIATLLVPLALLGTACVLFLGSVDNLPWRLAVEVGEAALSGSQALEHVIPDAAMFNPFSGVSLFAPQQHTIKLAVLDVGQGLSIVLSAGGKTLIYDTGDAPPLGISQAQKALIPYLNRMGVEDVAIRVISHADRDHAGGMTELAEQFAAQRAIGYAGIPCRVGEVLYQTSDITVTVLNGPGNNNDGSCVLQLKTAQVTVLLAGDVSAARERELIRYWRTTLRADILVVAHH
ncbi:MAG: ComEC/Rec2 family competence protein, partial [Flavobacteriaceae bacterium]|nr:ComEC/Rec2 family competence protein [Flavobacteriaceae bacterium]